MTLSRRSIPATLTLDIPHRGGQRALYLHPARFHVVACGRRFGKTKFGKLLTYETILRHGGEVWWVAPTYKMSSAIWREFRKELKPFASYVNSSDRIIEMPNGGQLVVWSGEQIDTARGGAPDLVIVDEAAMLKKGEEAWFGVLRPALNDKLGRAYFLSTPRGHNFFWTLFNMGQDPLLGEYMSWNFPSSNNPYFRQADLAEAEATLPARFFDQEYLAKFLDDAGGVFRGVTNVAVGEYRKPYAGDFVFGVDWGRDYDFTVISVFDRELQIQVDMDRFSNKSWNHQRRLLVAMYNKWKPSKIWAEKNSFGGPNIEELERQGLPVKAFDTNKSTKPEIIEGLALAIEKQSVILLNDRVQTAELQAYEMERMPGGSFRYNAPEGAHDDTVIATAIAYWATRKASIGNVTVLPSRA